jgi:hypothetical protein
VRLPAPGPGQRYRRGWLADGAGNREERPWTPSYWPFWRLRYRCGSRWSCGCGAMGTREVTVPVEIVTLVVVLAVFAAEITWIGWA